MSFPDYSRPGTLGGVTMRELRLVVVVGQEVEKDEAAPSLQIDASTPKVVTDNWGIISSMGRIILSRWIGGVEAGLTLFYTL